MPVENPERQRKTSPPPAIRVVRNHARLFLGAAAGLVLYAILPSQLRASTRLLTAWDFGAFMYLVLATVEFTQFDYARVRTRAAAQDEGAIVLLAIVVAAAIASLGAVVFELGLARTLAPGAERWIFLLVAVTTLLSWTLTHVVFAFHYAHEFYRAPRDPGAGLVFPQEERPDYWDFVYFSFVIGMTFQVSDVQVTSKALRRLVVAHGIVAFFFNVAILALTVNIGANMI
jgi:uncharacterized membrane protein